MKPLTFDQLQRLLDRYCREYRVPDGIWCIADDPHLAKTVHIRGDGFVACWSHSRERPTA